MNTRDLEIILNNLAASMVKAKLEIDKLNQSKTPRHVIELHKLYIIRHLVDNAIYEILNSKSEEKPNP